MITINVLGVRTFRKFTVVDFWDINLHHRFICRSVETIEFSEILSGRKLKLTETIEQHLFYALTRAGTRYS